MPAAKTSAIVNIDLDCTELLRKCKNYDKRLAYNVVTALNEAALAVQKAEKANVRAMLKVRNNSFIDQNIARIVKASVKAQRPYAEVFIPQKPRYLMPFLETGGTKVPGLFPELSHPTLGMPAIGGPARTDDMAKVPRSLYLTILKFKAARGGQVYLQKRLGLYAIKGVGVFQRVKGSSDGVLVYSYRTKVPLGKRLGWLKLAIATAQRTVQAALFREVSKSWDRAGRGY
jgi:hypothetical protein